MEFYCVYCKTRKKFDKFIKKNKIKNKYIIDIKKMLDNDGDKLDITDESDKKYLTLLIFTKINKAIEKNRNVYYIPDFNASFSIEKILNLKKILGNNNFNILLFYNEFKKSCDVDILNDALINLSKFTYSQIIEDC